jgi:hypothetical protein
MFSSLKNPHFYSPHCLYITALRYRYFAHCNTKKVSLCVQYKLFYLWKAVEVIYFGSKFKTKCIKGNKRLKLLSAYILHSLILFLLA